MSMGNLDVVRSVADLRGRLRYWRDQGLSVAFIPTMGALHAGHLALIEAGLEIADRVVSSIFVNPTQFGPNEDLSRYPRQEDRDTQLLDSVGCSLLFAPAVEEMYPVGFSSTVHVEGVSDMLEGAFRPGHFNGVATVVLKLLLQCLPDYALFGEKDWQQLTVIRRMAQDLDLPVQIIGVPTVREDHGLALSSRNAYLSDKERAIAPMLYRVLCEIAMGVASGGNPEVLCRRGRETLLQSGFNEVDYLEVRDGETLLPSANKGRVLVAARVGGTRLIDNVGVPETTDGFVPR